MDFYYHLNMKQHEKKSIIRSFIPIGILRLRNWIRYKNWFPNAFITSDSIISRNAKIGQNCIIRKASIGELVTIGDFTTIGEGSAFIGQGKIEIGKFCSIGPECNFFSHNHNHNYCTTYPLEQVLKGENYNWDEYIKSDIVIGNDVWLGARVSVMAGAKIGHGCIIGAGCVVPGKEFPPYSIIGGVPGRVIKKRFAANIIDSLLSVQWWNLPYEIIFKEKMGFLHDKFEENLN